MTIQTYSAVSFRDVSVAYDHRPALSNITLDIAAGEFVGVVGPNGAGKSTLLNAILRLIPLQRGEILIAGRSSAQARGAVSYMPQREGVDWTFPVTIQDVVMMGRQARLGWFRRPTRQDRAVVEWALEQVQMLDIRRTPIGELSGGQQQRVFLARALAQEGDLLLLDEPLTGVDATTQETILRLLRDMRSKGRTVIMTTHDLGVARAFCSRLLFLNQVAIAYGPPTETFTPEVLEKTYGGHILRLAPDAIALAPVDDSLMILRDGMHHTHAPGRGGKH
ncbi:MAG: metal ABC transporter ATP-binding protein [Anaerolineae bacterium]